MTDLSILLENPKQSAIKLFPELNEVSGIQDFQHPDKERIYRYMLLAYHPESPLIKKYTSVSQRKDKAAHYAGFDITKPKDSRLLQILYDFSEESFLALVHNFLIYINNRTWSMIVLNENTFREYQMQLLTPLVAAGDKNALGAAALKETLLKQIDEIDNRLEGYYHRLYMGDKDLMKEGTKRKGISPEMIAGNVQET